MDNTSVDLNNYTQEKKCFFEGEHYSVRDNGAVLRHATPGKRLRHNDNKWTFGKENSTNPYLHISDIRIHRVVATAFHGEPPDSKYVVDHIDSNCRNNRPENLRWLTRLENALKNPATRKKIEYLCGSIEVFLENPSMLNDLQSDPNFAWMLAVTPQEAENCRVRMSLWAHAENTSAKLPGAIKRKNYFERRIYRPLQKWEVGFGREPGLNLSLTLWCAEYMMTRFPAHFPCCPEEFGIDRLDDYFQNIKLGSILVCCDNDKYNDVCPELTVIDRVMTKETESIVVKCGREDGKWSVVGITLDKKTKWFIHFNLGSYSSLDKATEAFASKQGLKNFWSEGYSNAYA